ncbi:helix-turn-helix domain-containing protein, partial [Moraxella osloensis]|uniref:helix-turn-helix domain-containing protein n=1 Tax=Faucicola osloensis TaxID=34062 RepID=UPI00243081E0
HKGIVSEFWVSDNPGTVHLEQKITVADLAKYIDLSVSQLERLFKSVLNLSPTQMLQKIRLEYAIQLLNNTNLSIIEIAVRCGYSDHSAFTRQFKHMTNLTPSAFRKEIVQL